MTSSSAALHREAVLDRLWRIEDRCDKVSNKTAESEVRQMRSSYCMHELIRQVLTALFSFDHHCDATWVVRAVALELTSAVRALVRDGIFKADA